MRMSCNGCRVLRKGCSEDCTIRPCLEWIKTSDSQSNATLFLAKFYGRAGLMNLINSGAPHLRPGIFRSLLYEACGRIVNPVYGSVGLVSSGNWHLCQSAVEAVLNGAPISQMTADIKNGPPLNAYDIRHVSKPDNSSGSNDLNRVRSRSRYRLKRSGSKAKRSRLCVGSDEETNRSPSHESSLSHQSEAAEPIMVSESPESVSVAFAETVDPDDRARVEPDLHLVRYDEGQVGDGEVELELTLRL